MYQNPLKDVDSSVHKVKIRPCDPNLWPMTLKINRVPASPKDYVCTKFGQNPLKDLDSSVFRRMLCGTNLTLWPWPLTLKINRVPDSRKVCTKFGQNPLKDVDSRVFTKYSFPWLLKAFILQNKNPWLFQDSMTRTNPEHPSMDFDQTWYTFSPWLDNPEYKKMVECGK
jgi:hypothetical protein